MPLAIAIASLVVPRKSALTSTAPLLPMDEPAVTVASVRAPLLISESAYAPLRPTSETLAMSASVRGRCSPTAWTVALEELVIVPFRLAVVCAGRRAVGNETGEDGA